MEYFFIESDGNDVLIYVPFVDENGNYDFNYVEVLYFRRIRRNVYRFQKNEIIESPWVLSEKNIKKFEDNERYFFDEWGDLVERDEDII